MAAVAEDWQAAVRGPAFKHVGSLTGAQGRITHFDPTLRPLPPVKLQSCFDKGVRSI
jgi:hypothetical protein